MRHARITLAIACHLTLVAPAGAGTIGVPGDFPTIQDAIDAAGGGDEIVVSAGRYVETIDLLGKQITIRSTDPADPAVVAATVVDAAGLGSTVTSARSEGPATTLDGLTITGGHAKFGGGIVVRNGSRPTIRRCVVVGNEGSAGGGMFVGETADPFVTGTVFRLNTTFSGGDGAGVLCDETSPSFIDCRFEENVAECCGGGMLLTGGSSPLVSGCHFEGNRASSVGSSGGAIGIEEGSPTIKQTTFIDNEADAGGAVSSVEGAPVFSDCRFESNDATLGGGYWSFASTPIVQDTVFTENQATCGGGMYARFGTVTLEQCEFGANAAIGGDGGAGVFAWSLELTVERTTFADNVADFGGGGLYAHEATGLVSVCTFEGNAAIDQGGAICMEGGGPAITLATFVGNTSEVGGAVAADNASVLDVQASRFLDNNAPRGLGGAIFIGEPGGSLVNCLVAENTAEEGGGLFSTSPRSLDLINCTIAGNAATVIGGGAIVGVANVVNCILWVNVADGQMDADAQLFGGAVVTYSCVQGGWGGAGGTGTIADDPVFTGGRIDGYRLSAGSPCVDTGRNDALPPRVTTDLAGAPRVVNGVVDMGGYERQCPADLDDDGVVGFVDLLRVLTAWGPCVRCPEDVDRDGDVGLTDLLAVLGSWGACVP